MIWKSLLVAFLAVGVLAEIPVPEAQREQMRNQLKQYCKKNGAEDQAESIETAANAFMECAKSLFDPETIKKEIEEAKPNGALDEVFKKYCEKSPQLKTCLHTLINSAVPCLDPNFREHVGLAHNATDNLLDFVCYKDGDRIALFIAEKGPECFQEKSTPIRECANKLKETVPNVEAAKSLTLNEQCARFDELTTCVVKALEDCDTSTPANMAESLFKFIKNSTPCKK